MISTAVLVEHVSLRTALRKITGQCAAYLVPELVVMLIYSKLQMVAARDYFSKTITPATCALHLGVVLLCPNAVVGILWIKGRVISRNLLSAFEELRTIILEASALTSDKTGVERYGEFSGEKDEKVAKAPNGDMANKQTTMAEGDRADGPSETALDTTSSSTLQISPDSSLYEDVKRMREHLHRKQATTKLGSQPLHPDRNTLQEPGDDGPLASPDSDSGWAIISSTEDGAVMVPKVVRPLSTRPRKSSRPRIF